MIYLRNKESDNFKILFSCTFDDNSGISVGHLDFLFIYLILQILVNRQFKHHGHTGQINTEGRSNVPTVGSHVQEVPGEFGRV